MNQMEVQAVPARPDGSNAHFVVVDTNGNFFAKCYTTYDAGKISCIPVLYSAHDALCDLVAAMDSGCSNSVEIALATAKEALKQCSLSKGGAL